MSMLPESKSRHTFCLSASLSPGFMTESELKSSHGGDSGLSQRLNQVHMTCDSAGVESMFPEPKSESGPNSRVWVQVDSSWLWSKSELTLHLLSPSAVKACVWVKV